MIKPAFWIAFFASILTVNVSFAGSSNEYPSDLELKKFFQCHKQTFESLADEIGRQDKYSVVLPEQIDSYYYSNSKWGFNGEDIEFENVQKATGLNKSIWKLLQNGLKEISCYKITNERKASEINFVLWREIPLPFPSLEEKSIVFLKNRHIPEKICKNTGIMSPRPADINLPREKESVYSKIEDNWYIKLTRFGNIPPSLSKKRI